MSEVTRRDGVTRLGFEGRWLSSGYDGGYRDAPAAFNVTVPDGFDRTDLDAYTRERRARAGFDDGPTLLTGVAQTHARVARAGSVTAVATAGLSNPAELPMAPSGGPATDERWRPGTVNVLLATEQALTDGALASLHGVVVEAKTATLLAEAGVPGTTSDAVVVGCAGDGDPARFAGSATGVGSAARACVREAIRASLTSRYADEAPPGSVDEAAYGVSTERRADVFDPEDA